MKISIDRKTKRLFLNNSFPEKITYVNEPADSDFHFTLKNFNSYNPSEIKSHEISYLLGVRDDIDREQVRVREGFAVDNKISPRPDFTNFCFTHNDFCDVPYLIPAPFGPKFGDNKTIKNENFHNKVFWSGSLTHSTRRDFWSFYRKSINDTRFNISVFGERVYVNGFKPGTYETFLDTLSNSDIVYLLRGDRIWTHTFYDIIRAGCIPVMISSMNYYGWENIMKNVDDYMLRFDLREHSMRHIHQQVVSLLEDRSRVLHMKANIRKLHDMFFKHNNPEYGFSEFLLAKCIEIYKKGFDINKIDDKFICPEILNLKELGGKI